MSKIEKLIRVVVEIIFWIAIFLSPFLIFGIIAFILFLNDYKILAIISTLSGLAVGIYFAESIRRKYGCSAYMGRLLATPDLWPNEVDEKNKKNDEKELKKRHSFFSDD